mgnify:CR=1 FL=1
MLLNLRNVTPKPFNFSIKRTPDNTFGERYFDGTREEGCGGYHYKEGFWEPFCTKVIERYHLTTKSRILDIGCAKGFFLYDMQKLLPGLEIHGLEISEYAISHAPDSVRSAIVQGSAETLPYPDQHFDFVAAINTLHNLPYEKCMKGIQEIIRVSRSEGARDAYVEVDAYTTEQEKQLLVTWAAGVVQTFYSIDEWPKVFAEQGYLGDYYWTIIQ